MVLILQNLRHQLTQYAATKNLQSFVNAVNDARKLLNAKTFRGDATSEDAELSDDPVVKSIKKTN